MTLSNYSKFLISYSIGESIFVSLAGLLMSYIHPIALYFYALGWAFVNKVLFSSVLADLEEG